MSYFYRTEAAALGYTTTGVKSSSSVNVLMDATGAFHGSDRFRGARFNVLYGDGHVKSLTRAQFDEAFGTSLR